MPEKRRLCILISGGGTTALAIIKACNDGPLSGLVEPVCVIASRADAGGLKKAAAEGVLTFIVDPKKFTSPDQFGERIIGVCQTIGVDVITQNGWLPLTPQNVIAAYPGKMINQHPGPLDPGYPDFGGKGMYGMRVHAARLHFVRATDREESWTEAVAQLVAPEYDRGPVIHRERVEIEPGDTPENLQQRVLPIEHRVQIEALRLLVQGTAVPLVRKQRLVHHEEYELLIDAKKEAARQFPNG